MGIPIINTISKFTLTKNQTQKRPLKIPINQKHKWGFKLKVLANRPWKLEFMIKSCNYGIMVFSNSKSNLRQHLKTGYGISATKYLVPTILLKTINCTRMKRMRWIEEQLNRSVGFSYGLLTSNRTNSYHLIANKNTPPSRYSMN